MMSLLEAVVAPHGGPGFTGSGWALLPSLGLILFLGLSCRVVRRALALMEARKGECRAFSLSSFLAKYNPGSDALRMEAPSASFGLGILECSALRLLRILESQFSGSITRIFLLHLSGADPPFRKGLP